MHVFLITSPIEVRPFHDKHLVTGTPDKCFIKIIETYICLEVTLMKGKLIQ